MKKALVTGGTVFVSRYVAEYYVKHGYEVYVLNRNTRKQSEGVRLIEGDRHNPGEQLKHIHFDVVFDVTAYTATDISDLLDGLGGICLCVCIKKQKILSAEGRKHAASIFSCSGYVQIYGYPFGGEAGKSYL